MNVRLLTFFLANAKIYKKKITVLVRINFIWKVLALTVCLQSYRKMKRTPTHKIYLNYFIIPRQIYPLEILT